LLKCKHCGYEWEYKGKLARASCPSCGQKVKASQQDRIVADREYNEPQAEREDSLSGLGTYVESRIAEVPPARKLHVAQLIRQLVDAAISAEKADS
jgi:hypothetical protein